MNGYDDIWDIGVVASPLAGGGGGVTPSAGGGVVIGTLNIGTNGFIPIPVIGAYSVDE